MVLYKFCALIINKNKKKEAYSLPYMLKIYL